MKIQSVFNQSSKFSNTESFYFPFYFSFRNDQIQKKGEDVDFFAIVLHGSMFVAAQNMRLKTLSIGDMIGFMNVSEMTTQNKAKYDIVAESDGLIAVLPLGEIKVESRRYP